MRIWTQERAASGNFLVKRMNNFFKLTEKQKALYDQIASALSFHENKIQLRDEESIEEIQDMLQLAHLNEVTLFHVNFQSIKVTRGFFGTSLNVEYFCSPSEAEQRKHLLEQKREIILSQFSGGDEAEKTEFVHDYLAENVRYDFAAARDHISTRAFSVEGALIDGLAVCSGIAQAARYLLEGLGIESLVVSGKGENPDNQLSGKEAAHAWNLNMLSDGNYHMDITWDLEEASPLRVALHQYCNVDDETLIMDHDWDFLRYPRAMSMTNNYFNRRGAYCRNKKAIKNYVEQCLVKKEKIITLRLDPCAGFPDDNGKSVIQNIVKTVGQHMNKNDTKINYMYNSTMLIITLLVQYT